MDDEGEYSCEADNIVGSITAMGSLIVHCMLISFLSKFFRETLTIMSKIAII